MGIQNSQRDTGLSVFPPEYAAAIQNALGGAEQSIDPSEYIRTVEVDIKVHTPEGTEDVRFALCPTVQGGKDIPFMSVAACLTQTIERVTVELSEIITHMVWHGRTNGEPQALNTEILFQYMDPADWPTNLPPAPDLNCTN